MNFRQKPRRRLSHRGGKFLTCMVKLGVPGCSSFLSMISRDIILSDESDSKGPCAKPLSNQTTASVYLTSVLWTRQLLQLLQLYQSRLVLGGTREHSAILP